MPFLEFLLYYIFLNFRGFICVWLADCRLLGLPSPGERAVSAHRESHFNLHSKDFSRFPHGAGKRVRNKWAATVHKKRREPNGKPGNAREAAGKGRRLSGVIIPLSTQMKSNAQNHKSKICAGWIIPKKEKFCSERGWAEERKKGKGHSEQGKAVGKCISQAIIDCNCCCWSDKHIALTTLARISIFLSLLASLSASPSVPH